MNRNFKFFIGAVLTVFYLTASLFASASTKNTYKNSNLVELTGGSNDCPCLYDDPRTTLDDTCSCEDDGSGGPNNPPDDDE
jgi:hypothetical protein